MKPEQIEKIIENLEILLLIIGLFTNIGLLLTSSQKMRKI